MLVFNFFLNIIISLSSSTAPTSRCRQPLNAKFVRYQQRFRADLRLLDDFRHPCIYSPHDRRLDDEGNKVDHSDHFRIHLRVVNEFGRRHHRPSQCIQLDVAYDTVN